MADPYSRNDPVTGAPRAQKMQVTEDDNRSVDYQAEIEKLRADMGKLAESVSDSVKNTVQPMARELEATVARNPTVSVAIAAGVGLLLGVMMSRK